MLIEQLLIEQTIVNCVALIVLIKHNLINSLIQMHDITSILRARKSYLLQDCDFFKLQSVLMLLDASVTEVLTRASSQPEHVSYPTH